MKWSDKADKLLLAMAEVQAKVGPVLKNAVNPHFKNRYADLSAVWHTLSEHLPDAGLVVTQGGAIRDGKPLLVTRISDANTGQWVESELPLDGGKTDPQGLGSAITYMRRYSLCAMFGLMTEDDDGEGAARRPEPQRQQPAKKAPAKAAKLPEFTVDTPILVGDGDTRKPAKDMDDAQIETVHGWWQAKRARSEGVNREAAERIVTMLETEMKRRGLEPAPF